MKKLIFMAVIVIALIVSATATTQAQTLQWPFAAADYQAVTATNDSVQFTASNRMTLVSSTIDTTTVVKCTVSDFVTDGSELHIKITAPSSANQTISFSGITAANATITKAKTVIYSFIYFHDGYKIYATQQIN
jgi:hypothetical protein